DAGQLEESDVRRKHPRFSADNLKKNVALVDRIADIAKAKGVTPAQIALAWVLNQGNDIVPIPGARKIRNLEDNAAATEIRLDASEMTALGEAVPAEEVAGARYGAAALAMVNK